MYMHPEQPKAQANYPNMISSLGYGEPQGQREPEFPAELGRLAKALEQASGGLNELHARLDGKVIRPSEPMTISSEKQLASVGPSTFYAQEINQYARQVNDLSERIQNILRRLEV